MESQSGNTVRLITLIKAIYNALTYTVYKFTFYGYESIKSISRDGDNDTD